jgi:hypothetical protein
MTIAKAVLNIGGMYPAAMIAIALEAVGVWNRQLSAKHLQDFHRHGGGLVRQNANEADGGQQNGITQTVMVTPQHLDGFTVFIAQVEVTFQLFTAGRINIAAETLYREGRLSVSAIGEKLHISKSTLYSYLRHRGVEIGAYQKSARSRDQQPSAASPAEPPAAERVATVTLRLAVVNNSKFVRGRKRATENIERYCLEPYGMKRLDAGHYELTIPYRSDDELDKSVHDLLTEISQEADMRNCFVEMGAWEEDTEKRW